MNGLVRQQNEAKLKSKKKRSANELDIRCKEPKNKRLQLETEKLKWEILAKRGSIFSDVVE